MNIIKNAKAHFQDQLSGELSCIEVPEWGEDGEPAKIYYRKVMSHKTQRQINQHAKDGDIEALIDIVLLRSLDASGKRLFSPSNRTDFQSFIDPKVIQRICEQMGEDDTTIEDARGN